MTNSLHIYSSRVEEYRKYRPGYPASLLALLRQHCGFDEKSVVADVGSGTGLLARLFLENGNRVYGIEPDAEMRHAADDLLAGYPRFTSLDAAAEATTLDDRSIDFVTAGQAFHWFKPQQARREFARILKPGGWAVLVWNVFRTDTPFLAAYAQFTRTWLHPGIGEKDSDIFTPFFGAGRFTSTVLDNRENERRSDFAAFKGGVLSSSAAPRPGAPTYDTFVAALRSLFDAHQVEGVVTVQFDTSVIYGQLSDMDFAL
jgi:SAM-dependent methyltransferase